MSRVVILTDSTADLPDSFVSEYNITVLPLSIIWEGSSYRDGVDMRPQEFYRRLKGARELPTTSQVTTPAFESAFTSIIERGDCVLAMLVSSKLSGTYDAAIQAREAVPAARDKITVLDDGVGLPKRVQPGLGLRVTHGGVLSGIKVNGLQVSGNDWQSPDYASATHHADLNINLGSTMTLDFGLHDRPVVNVAFDVADPPITTCRQFANFSSIVRWSRTRAALQ